MNGFEEPKNGGVRITWHWLAVTLIPITIALTIYIYQMAKADTDGKLQNVNDRLTADESKIGDDHDNISAIKSDVSYIKGLLQQKWGIAPNQ